MILNDFVMLGKTVPEEQSDKRVFVCSAGVSPTHGLIRIYPLGRAGAPQRWSINTVSVEKPPRQKDSRDESWKLAGDRSPHEHPRINFQAFRSLGTYPKSGRAALLAPYRVGSIAEANERKLSLAILDGHAYKLTFDENEDNPQSDQLALLDGPPVDTKGAKSYPYMPRLGFFDESGWHNIQCRDWGCYEWLRKHGPGRRHEMDRCLHLSDASALLVGNLANIRSTWLVISVLNGVRQPHLKAVS